MAKKKTDAAEGTSPADAASPPPGSATVADAVPVEPKNAAPNGAQRLPVLKIGPILTDKGSAIECGVWETAFTASGGQVFPIHTVTVQSLSRDEGGQWKPQKGFRGSQLYVLLYCLQRASDFILAKRDPANDCPF